MSDENIKTLAELIRDYNDNKIWVTRKCRIYSEERMKFYNRNILSYEITLSAMISIMNFVTMKSIFDFGILVGIYSAVLTILTIVQYKSKFGERAEQFKKCYLELSKIYDKTKLVLINNQSDRTLCFYYEDLIKKYDKILNDYENHAEIDYDFAKSDQNYRKRVIRFNIFIHRFIANIIIIFIPIIMYRLR